VRRPQYLSDTQVVVLAAVERMGEARLGDLSRELPFVNVLRLADELQAHQDLGFVEPASVDAGPSRLVDEIRWLPSPIRS
jgi:hypothetical protein